MHKYQLVSYSKYTKLTRDVNTLGEQGSVPSSVSDLFFLYPDPFAHYPA